MNNKSFVKELTKIVVINAAVSAAATAGMIGGLLVVASIAQKFQKKS